MKKALLTVAAIAIAFIAGAQSPITVSISDMPVNNDTLRWSAANAFNTGINTGQTGANTTWNFTSLTAVQQGVDHYQLAAQVNFAYAAVISPTAYGYKVADSIPGLPPQSPVSPKNIYTFFNKKVGPARFVAEGFGATISGIPVPAAYSDEDEIYFFPLTYPHGQDSTTFKLKVSLGTTGSYGQQGYRKTTVDGWGTIATPFTATPVSVIRVRSEVVAIDSVSFGGTAFGFPRNTVEYKWLASGQHYPMMWITANKIGNTETITSVRYRDTKRSLAVSNPAGCQCIGVLSVSPTPATAGMLNIEVPVGILDYRITLWDMSGKMVQTAQNAHTMDISALPHGQYLLRAESGDWQGLARVLR